jgi:hypothetical protein
VDDWTVQLEEGRMSPRIWKFFQITFNASFYNINFNRASSDSFTFQGRKVL